MYDRTRFKYSAWSILVRAYPTILMSLGRNLFRYCGRWLMHSPNHASNNDAPSTYQAEECGELNICQLAAISPLHCIDGMGSQQRGGTASPTVFFFARSPEAPSTTITVSSLSSIKLDVEPESEFWSCLPIAAWTPGCRNRHHCRQAQRHSRAGGPALENPSWTGPVGAQRDVPGLRQKLIATATAALSFFFFFFCDVAAKSTGLCGGVPPRQWRQYR